MQGHFIVGDLIAFLVKTYRSYRACIKFSVLTDRIGKDPTLYIAGGLML